MKAQFDTVIDGHLYKKDEEIWDLGSFECIGVDDNNWSNRRHYLGKSSDIGKLPHYVASGSKALCADTGDVYMFLKGDDTWYKVSTGTGTGTPTIKLPTGENALSTPEQNESIGTENGGKRISDLIKVSSPIEWVDTVGTVKDTIKFIGNYGSPYEGEQRMGHFYPIKFDQQYWGKEINIGGQNGVGGKNIIPSSTDPYLVIRVENVTVESKIKAVLVADLSEIFTLDFSKATLSDSPSGQDAISVTMNATFGDQGKATDFCSNVKISWDGTVGDVTGTFYKGNPTKKYNIPLAISSIYQEQNITVAGIPQTELVGHFEITDTSSSIAVKWGDTVIAELKFTGATFDEGWSPSRLASSDGTNVPDAKQTLLGSIKVKDLIRSDAKFEYDGKNIKVSATANNTIDPWTEFDTENNTGHFFPILLPVDCVGQTVSIKGRKSGARTAKVGEDRLLVQRLENLNSDQMTIAINNQDCIVYDFSRVNYEIPAEVLPQSASTGIANGDKKVSDLIDADATITWAGATGSVTGGIKKVKSYGELYPEDENSGHFFPLKFESKYYGKSVEISGRDNEVVKTVVPTEDDPYLIIRIENFAKSKKAVATLSDTKTEIFTLDFNGATLNE